MDNDTSVNQPIIKVFSAWLFAILAKFGIHDWAALSSAASTIASVVAAIYTICLLTEWWWRKFWRPMLERRGIVKRRLRRKQDRTLTP